MHGTVCLAIRLCSGKVHFSLSFWALIFPLVGLHPAAAALIVLSCHILSCLVLSYLVLLF